VCKCFKIIIVFGALFCSKIVQDIHLFEKKAENILSIQKKVVPLRAFSAFGLQSSAAEGTDDTHLGYANVDDSASRLTDM